MTSLKPCLTVFKTDDYVRFHRFESIGVSALTHLASLKTEKGPRHAYIKAYRPEAHRGLLNEIVGYILAHHAHLPQPDGGVISLPTAHLRGLFPAEELSEEEHTPCFASVDAQDILRRSTGTAKVLFGDNLKELAASLKNWRAYALMVAFDEWLANIDRNSGNLLMIGLDDYWAIDHGHLLTGPAWFGEDLDPDNWSENKMLDLFFSHASLPLPMKNAIVKSSEAFLAVYARAQPELQKWLSGEMGSDESMADAFIGSRSAQISDHLKRRLLVM